MRAVGASEISVQSYEATQRHVPEDSITHDDCNKNIKSHVFLCSMLYRRLNLYYHFIPQYIFKYITLHDIKFSAL